MTPGERIVRCLTGGDIDRVPFGCELGWQFWAETYAKFEAAWRAEGNSGVFEPFYAFGYDRGFAQVPYEAGVFPHFERKILEEDAESYIAVDYQGITARRLKHNRSIPEYIDYPVKTPDDWDRFKSERFDFSPAAIDARLAAREEELARFIPWAKSEGVALQIGEYPLGVFGCARDFMGAEEVLVAFYEEPDMVKDMMTTCAKMWLTVYERVIDRLKREGARADRFQIWEDMSGRNGSLISPAMIEEFMMPVYDMINDFRTAHGIRVMSVDSDGDCSELVPIMMRHGVNFFYPFEVQAGCDIREYRRLYPELGIYGGLDKRAMARDEAAVDEQIALAGEMVKAGRYVPGFDHHIPSDCEYHLFKRAVAGIKILCGK